MRMYLILLHHEGVFGALTVTFGTMGLAVDDQSGVVVF